MRPIRSLIPLVSTACLSLAAPLAAAGRAHSERLEHVRVPFVENCGQFDERVAFAAPTLFGTEWVTRDGSLVYRTRRGEGVRETFVAPLARPFAGLPSRTNASYFLGDDPARWQPSVATYSEIGFGEVWPGISVVLRADGRTVEKIFVVQPGSRLRDIRLRIEGAGGLRIDGSGAIIADTADGRVRFTPPQAYQELSGGERRPVSAAYVLRGKEYGFRLGPHEPALPVVIDPLLQSTYLGGGENDSISAIAIHPISGEVLVMGGTSSTDLPGSQGGARPTYDGGVTDSFVARFDSSLTQLLQVTYFGGGDQEGIGALAVDPSSGDVLIGGFTQSTDLPGAAGGAQPAKIGSGEDGYVARFDASLTHLIQATYFGGIGEDFVTAMAVDPSTGEILIAGNTFSTDLLGTAGSAQPSIASSPDPYVGIQGDGFVARLDSTLHSIVRTSYVGGLGVDRIFGIALQPSSGDLLVAGDTSSTDLPGTEGAAVRDSHGDYDGFVALFDAGLTTLRGATYFGGTGYDGVLGIAVNPTTADVLVAGFTTAADLPGTSGGAQPSSQGGDADGFIARFDATLTTLRRATYLGGSGGDFLYAIAVHPNGDVYVDGETGSANFPGTAGGAQANYVGTPHPLAYASDVFVTRLDASLTTILQSTFLGGTGEDDARAIALDPSTNSVYVAGETSSSDFPGVAGGAQPTFAGGPNTQFPKEDGFVTRLTADLSNGSCQPTANALCLNGNRFSVTVAWSVPDQGTSGAGLAVPLTGDTGMFWFFDASNVELVVKVLDGTALNGSYWVFYGALSDVAYTITVTDRQTGRVRKYENPRGTVSSIADTSAFAESGPGGVSTLPSASEAYALYELRSKVQRPAAEPINPCAPGGTTLCLRGQRFHVTVDWEIPEQGRSGHGVAFPITADTGAFWFFDDSNVELVVKVLDGRALNGHFWVFGGGLTGLSYTLRITDSETGETWTWNNGEGQLVSWADTAAF